MCLKKIEVSDERFSDCDVIKEVEEHDIHCLPCSYTSEVRFVLILRMMSHLCQSDVIGMSFCQGTKHNSC